VLKKFDYDELEMQPLAAAVAAAGSLTPAGTAWAWRHIYAR
jgi:hypothetical protein